MKHETITKFYIVRHGQTDGNLRKVIQGHKDFPLNSTGVEQARKLSISLKSIRFDAAFSSDLIRAKKTAEIIAVEHNLIVTATKALRERCYGKFEGVSKIDWPKEIREKFEHWHILTDSQWMKTRLDENFETGEEVVGRFLIFIREISVGYPGKNILVVCHGDLMRNVLVKMGWGSKTELEGNTIANASYFLLESDGSEFQITSSEGIKINRINDS